MKTVGGLRSSQNRGIEPTQAWAYFVASRLQPAAHGQTTVGPLAADGSRRGVVSGKLAKKVKNNAAVLEATLNSVSRFLSSAQQRLTTAYKMPSPKTRAFFNKLLGRKLARLTCHPAQFMREFLN
jgi:hypothetical protein